VNANGVAAQRMPTLPFFPNLSTYIHRTRLRENTAQASCRCVFHQSAALITTTSFRDVFCLIVFVNALMSVKIVKTAVKSQAARNPQTAAFPQHLGRLRALYLAEKRVQYVSGLSQRGKAT